MNATHMTFHFLRPEWLLVLLPAAWLGWKLWQRRSEQSSWQEIINPSFKPILLGKSAENADKPWEVVGLMAIWFSAIIALSGPTWEQVKVPAEKSTEGTVILQDLSLSMLADDLKPNRITRTQYKLIDLLKQHPEMASGMVVYAGTAHTLAPISDDNETLLSLIPHLNPTMMPKYGSNAVEGVKQALSLFKGAHVKHGHLIWVMDDIEAKEVPEVISLIKHSDVSVSILISGTPDGGPIPVPNYGLLKDDSGKIIMAKIPVERIQKLAQSLGARVTLMQNSDDDLSVLLPPFLNQLPTQQAKDKQTPPKSFVDWLDKGVYLLYLLIPLAALAYRRGWLFSISISGLLAAWLLAAGSAYSPSSYAAEPIDKNKHEDASVHFTDVFKSPNQQGYEKWQQKDYETAADRFESPAWKGASYYKAGDYQEALKQFKLDPSPQGHYNLGNTYAHLGELEKAKEQYESALKTRPNWQQAKQNLQLVDSLLKQKNKQQNDASSQSQAQDNQQSNQQSKQKGSGGNQPQKQGQENANANQSGNSDAKNDLNQPIQPKSQQAASDQKDQQNKQAEKEKQSNAQDNQQANEQGKQQQNKPSDAGKKNGQTGQQATEMSQVNADKNQQNLAQKKASPTQLSDQMDGKKSAQSGKKLTEEEQAEKAWLNQIPDQPGLFLKRKFEYQYQLQHQNADEAQEPDKSW